MGKVVVTQLGHRLLGAEQHRVNIDPGHGHRQQAHRGQHGIPSAHIIGNDKGLPAFPVRQRFQRPAGAVGGAVDAPRRFLAVALLHHAAQHTESQRRLGGGAGFGNHIEGNPFALAQRQDLIQVAAGKIAPGKIDGGAILAQGVIVGAAQQLDGAAGAQVAAADTDDNKHIGVAADLFGRRVDARQLLFIVVPRQGQPAVEITARAGVLPQLTNSCRHLGGHAVHFVGGNKPLQILFP